MEKDNSIDFGIATFDKKRMKKKLPYPIYMKWKDAVRKEDILDNTTADIIAHAMKEWAIENGATHYCHWFQPLNGLTAKKHDSFLDRNSDMDPIIRFSGKELIKSEPDASSFPNGGIRSTFEARGYTYWDCTSNTFIVDKIMYIPSIFVSFNGETLDKKAPLLRSLDFISLHASRIENLFSDIHIYRVRSKVGLEQEFFLIDKEMYEKRPDLKNCGRTLVGSSPVKNQELMNHYFGSIPERIARFYEEINYELWNLGIFAKTEHNEVAPCQFEIACLYENANVAIDQNQLAMEILQKVAIKHNLVCLLHEKPFNHVNGSGKHNNWSLVTNYGDNCFEPGDDPRKKIKFLLYMAAVIKAVDVSSTLLRVASSTPRNDYRLGGDEAPPSIISIYLGEELESILYKVIDDDYDKELPMTDYRIPNLAYVPHELSDRNRTSPFAFTGNRFEFRMLGSSMSASDVNIVLNTYVGHELKEMADILEKVDPEKQEKKAYKLVKEILIKHKRILYGSDNYSQIWIDEAKKRGLPIYDNFLEALLATKNSDILNVLSQQEILNKEEQIALFEIALENVINEHTLELRQLIDMVNKYILPSTLNEIIKYSDSLKLVTNKSIESRLNTLNENTDNIMSYLNQLSEKLEKSMQISNHEERAKYLQYELLPLGNKIRNISDYIESIISKSNWILPTYEDIFNSI